MESYVLFFINQEDKEFAAFAVGKPKLRKAIENNVKSDFMTFGPPDKKKHEQIRSLRDIFLTDPDIRVINKYLHFGVIEKIADDGDAEIMTAGYREEPGIISPVAEKSKKIILEHREEAIRWWRQEHGKNPKQDPADKD